MKQASTMRVEKVKYVLWAADWQRCLHFYRELFGGVISFESETWSEIVVAGATLGIHGGGEGKRTWTGLSFQLDDRGRPTGFVHYGDGRAAGGGTLASRVDGR